jgi:hypothetical protein
MANQLSNLLNEVVSVLDSMPLVNTIVLKDDNVVDVEKENVYPLVNIRFVNSPAPETDIRNYVLAFEVYNQRDDRKIATPSKLMSDTNYIDNMGIVDSIANNFVLNFLKTHNDYDIGIVDDGVSEFEPTAKDERNCLDGIKFEVTFYTHQNDI